LTDPAIPEEVVRVVRVAAEAGPPQLGFHGSATILLDGPELSRRRFLERDRIEGAPSR